MDLLEREVPQVVLDYPEIQDLREMLDQKVKLGLVVNRVTPVQWVHQATKAIEAHGALLDSRVTRVLPEKRVFEVNVETKEPRENVAT